MGKRRISETKGPYLLHLQLMRDRVPSFDRFPFCLPAVRNLDQLAFHPKVTFLVGENGSGKSTLLEALAVACDLNPEGGSRGFNFATRASHSSLHEHVRLARTIHLARDSYFLRAESFYNVASTLERLDTNKPGHFVPPPLTDAYGGVSLHKQSHGESFFALFANRFKGNGLYLLDEPEAALSPKRQLEFLTVLHDYCRQGAQFVIATHSPIIMSYPDAAIYVLGSDGVRQTPYQETEHYLITRGFLSSPQKRLSELLSADQNKSRSGD